MYPQTWTMRVSSVLTTALLALAAKEAVATQPPQGGGALPAAFKQRAAALPPGSSAFTFNRSLTQVTQRAFLARAIARMPRVSPQGLQQPQQEALAAIFGGMDKVAAAEHVDGKREIPIIAIRFAEYPRDPYPTANLQKELFDGPWPSGTMREYYSEISRGRLDLTGTVSGWVRSGQRSAYYEGADFRDQQTGELEPCYGTCTNGKLGELIREALSSPAGEQIDWGKYDNDGPDGRPNSGDDDGYVDFVAFVHSEPGGECVRPGNKNIWSHRWNLAGLAGQAYETKSAKAGGGFIQIDDYVIQPGLACDARTMIEIGVFAHEFGHAFGLPDLYDTNPSNGDSAGIGNWCLMAGGSWGGDGESPQRPSHMSPWAKEFLGWIDVGDVSADEHGSSLEDVQDGAIRKLTVSANINYLLANVQQRGFNDRLPGPGLQIWKINQSVINRGLSNNTVNANEFNRGVELVEADGNRSLDDPARRGEPGDVYPGPSGNRTFDANSTPASVGRVAVCHISDSGPTMSMDLQVGRTSCAGPAPTEQQTSTSEPALQNRGPVFGVSDLEALASGTRVRTQGFLENVGSNYFRAKDRRIALVGEDGSAVDVVVETPSEYRQNPTDATKPALPALLGKPVVVEGTVEWRTSDQGRQLRLRVDSVQPQ